MGRNIHTSTFLIYVGVRQFNFPLKQLITYMLYMGSTFKTFSFADRLILPSIPFLRQNIPRHQKRKGGKPREVRGDRNDSIRLAPRFALSSQSPSPLASPFSLQSASNAPRACSSSDGRDHTILPFCIFHICVQILPS